MNTEQPALLIELMHYIKNKYGSYSLTGVDPIEAAELISVNKNDTALMYRIDILLAHPVYRYFSEIMQATVNGKLIKGSDAYRLAFTSLPWQQIDMSAGFISRLVEYFNRSDNNAALDIVKYINQNRSMAEDTVFSMVNNYLPKECRASGIVNIYPAIDGNRGSFAEGNDIVMELSSYSNGNAGLFLTTAAHEMHHVCYGNWLNRNYSDSNLTPSEKVIYDWQMRMIYEGSAQQINYSMYSQPVKDLYMKQSLILELFNVWLSSFTKLYSSANPDSQYGEMREYLYNTYSQELLKKYYGESYNSLMPYRPTVDYYISYHIYNTIYRSKGADGLNYVLLNPEDLLNSYNASLTGSSIAPEIPADIVTIWVNVLQTSKTVKQ